ncbi:MAG TPA: hypothetical protein VHH88_07950, partial [Verrucomicrobiae bacterium]|nr:hypothetical protein [Verrucomicrobiae bacterium]
MNKTVFIGLVLMPALAVLPSAQAQTYHSLQPMAGFGTYGNGEMLADGSVPFLTTGAVQRGLCRNPLTGNLIFVDRAVSGQSGSVSGAIYVLDGATGAVLNTLSTNGIDGGSFADYAVAVGPDGVIYVDNVIADSNSGPFKIYRWASEAGQDDPTVAFSGALGTNNLRWGNSMDVRGTGAGTQILVSSGGAEAALFTTSDGVNFAATDLFMDVTGTLQGSVGFGLGNTFWAKWAGLDLRLLSFDAGAQTATTIRDFGGTDMPEMAAPEIAGIDTSNNLLAVVSYHSTNPDEVLLYSIANLDDLPQLLDAYTLSDINNANSGSPRGYLAIGGGKLYAHNLNNGIFAFNLLSDALPAPAILTQPLSMS